MVPGTETCSHSAEQEAKPLVVARRTQRGFGRVGLVAAQLSLFLFSLAVGAAAQDNASVTPPQLRGVGIDQRLNNQVPLDLKFRDETGQTVTLGSYFGKKPVILSLVYYTLPDAVHDGGKWPFERAAGCEVQHRRTIRSGDGEH